MLVAYANQYLRSPEDAREVVQDVFVGVWNNREHLAYDDSLKPYLFTATRNRTLNHLRKRREKTVALDEVGEAAAAVKSEGEAQMEAEEMRALIFDEVNRLPERCRRIFLLSRQEALSYREIAERLDVSVKTVENQIAIALKRLRARVTTGNDELRLAAPWFIGLAAASWLLKFLVKKCFFLWG